MANKIVQKLNAIPSDKVYHFFMCLLISLSATVTGKMLDATLVLALVIGWTSGMVVGFAKEVLDEINKNGSFDKQDMLADTIGCTAGALIAYLLMY